MGAIDALQRYVPLFRKGIASRNSQMRKLCAGALLTLKDVASFQDAVAVALEEAVPLDDDQQSFILANVTRRQLDLLTLAVDSDHEPTREFAF